MDLGRRQLRVPQLADDRRHEQPRWTGRTPLVDDEVVVGADADVGQRLVLEREEEGPGEAWQGREQHRGEDAVGQHVLGPLDGVVAGRAHLREADRVRVELVAWPSDHGVEAHRLAADVLVEPVLTAALLDHARRGGTELGRHPGLPHLGVLDDVVVGAEQLEHDGPLAIPRGGAEVPALAGYTEPYPRIKCWR